MQHTSFSSASKHERRAGCAGSYAAEMAIPAEERDKPSQAAEDGTRRHLLAEWRFDNPGASDPTEIKDDEGKVHTVTRDDQLAVDKVFPYVEKHPAYLNRGKRGYLALAEQNVDFGRWCDAQPGDAKGTADLVLIQPGVIEIGDYKFGRHIVSPDSWQFKTLAVGVIGDLLVDPATGQFLADYAQAKKIKLTVLQPLAPEPVRSVEFDLSVIGEWMGSIKGHFAALRAPDAKRTPGDWCKWCAAAGSCRERMAAAGVAIETMFDKVDAPPGPAPIATVDRIAELADVKMAQDPDDLSPEEIGRVCDQALLIEGWIEDVRKRRDDLLAAGKAVPGWKLIEGPRKREWAQDEAETVKLLRKWVGMGDIYEKKLISPAKAEKLENCVKTKVRKQQLEAMIRVLDGKPKAVPESDPHPAVRSAETMFDPVAETAPENLVIPDFM